MTDANVTLSDNLSLEEPGRPAERQMGSALCGSGEGPWPPLPEGLTNTPLDELKVRKPYRVYDLTGKWLEGEYDGFNLDGDLMFRFGEFSLVISPASIEKAIRL